MALADLQTTTVKFIIPSSVSHSIGYAGSCGSSDFAFLESDGTKDGTQTEINVTQGDGTECQNGSTSAITITNNGNDYINITLNFTSALPSGVTVKASNSSNGYESTCSLTEADIPVSGQCKIVNNTVDALLSYNLTASSTEDVWLWADFSSFNSGLATGAGGITRTLQTNAIKN